MNPRQLVRSALLGTRAAITAPGRRRQLKQLSSRNAAPLLVPFYHRVADTHANEWTISREQFRRHAERCVKDFEPVSLDELQRRVWANNSPRPTITMTFDDGYQENCDFAIPLLLELGIPCVYFVTIDHTLNQKPFPHDVAAGTPLPVNTVADLRDMADAGIEIGLHTYSHVDFATVSTPQTIQSEIVQSKDQLEQMIGRPVKHFAFPYGLPQQLTQAAIESVHQAGLVSFCSAFGAYNLPGRDAFHIRRFHGDPEFARFKNWLSFDQRKVRMEPRVRYFLPPARSHQETNENLCAQIALN